MFVYLRDRKGRTKVGFTYSGFLLIFIWCFTGIRYVVAYEKIYIMFTVIEESLLT